MNAGSLAILYIKTANGDEESGGKTPSQDAVMEFLKKNPSPTDEKFHKWCEDNGYNTSKAEAVAYRIASKAGGEEKTAEGISSGMTVDEIAKKHKVDASAINKQIEMGIKVEKEHTDSEEKARRIAMDHLTEMPDYYTKLNKMEKQGAIHPADLARIRSKAISGLETVLAKKKAKMRSPFEAIYERIKPSMVRPRPEGVGFAMGAEIPRSMA